MANDSIDTRAYQPCNWYFDDLYRILFYTSNIQSHNQQIFERIVYELQIIHFTVAIF